MRGYARHGSGGNVIYRRTVRASIWAPPRGVIASGTWVALIHRSMYSATVISGRRGWRYVVVGGYGDENRHRIIAEGTAPTLREAMDAADAALESGRDAPLEVNA